MYLHDVEAPTPDVDILSPHRPEGLMTRARLDDSGEHSGEHGRQSVVDEEELMRALSRDPVIATGLDVYDREPEIAPDLRALENIVLLPHLASATSFMGQRMDANPPAVPAGDDPPDWVA